MRDWKALIDKQKLNWVAIFPSGFELKSIRAVSKVIWQLLHKYSPSLHLGDLLGPVKPHHTLLETVFQTYGHGPHT